MRLDMEKPYWWAFRSFRFKNVWVCVDMSKFNVVGDASSPVDRKA
ncbi:MAG: hypothetical protein SFU99_06450 [Saprospiraceae bacterium]|nr:hypothetical protein [Saprospiraceae bacterium]